MSESTSPAVEFPTTPEAASGRQGELRAGGTDLQERRHLRLSRGAVVDLRDVANLGAIEARAPGLHIGALTRIAAIASHAEIKANYPGLAQAAGGLATPEIRNRATIAGNLLQQVRCWYYRQPGATCLRAGGSGCPARTGDHVLYLIWQRSDSPADSTTTSDRLPRNSSQPMSISSFHSEAQRRSLRKRRHRQFRSSSRSNPTPWHSNWLPRWSDLAPT